MKQICRILLWLPSSCSYMSQFVVHTFKLLFLGQPFIFQLWLASGEHVLVLGVGLLHLPVEGRGREHGFDGFEGAIAGFGVDQVDDTDPDEVQSGEEEVGTTL